MPDTSATWVVVVTYNGIAQTLDCLESVFRLQPPPRHVVVVDNASRDGTPAVLAQRFPRVTLVANASNLGYAEGANIGFRRALAGGAEYVLLLNNDAVVAQGALTALLDAAAAHPRAGFFGAKIYYRSEPARIWYAGAQWRSDLLCFEHRDKDTVESAAPTGLPQGLETDYACGCVLLVRTAVLQQVGFMDARFFLSYEEADLCFRARRHGFPSLLVPGAHVWHTVSAAFGGEHSPLRLYYDTRNALLFGERHLPESEHRRLLAQSLAQAFPGFANLHVRTFALRSLPALLWEAAQRVRRTTARPADRARYLGLRDYLLRRFYRAPAELCQ